MNVTRLFVWAVVVVGGLLAVDALADATQNRPDLVSADTRSTIVYEVAVRGDADREEHAAQALWGVCVGTVEHVNVVEGPESVERGWSVTVEPALGEHSRRRLVGCLEDVTLDGVISHVVDLTPAATGSRR
ncbi:MAG: hypothetical protein ACRD29_07170 [Acidimicrobiales bacterium]